MAESPPGAAEVSRTRCTRAKESAHGVSGRNEGRVISANKQPRARVLCLPHSPSYWNKRRRADGRASVRRKYTTKQMPVNTQQASVNDCQASVKTRQASVKRTPASFYEECQASVIKHLQEQELENTQARVQCTSAQQRGKLCNVSARMKRKSLRTHLNS